MADWRRRASSLTLDVAFFELVTSKYAKTAELVYVWDIDKTYLDTQFESLRGILRTALEKAFQKKNVPGTKALVRALTSSRDLEKEQDPFPIYFVSASPPQMEKKIRNKLEMDGVKPYGLFFKDNLRNLRPGMLSRLKQHVGYKVQALMELRSHLGDDTRMILWGDDSESDAVVYSLFSDLCSHRVSDSAASKVLEFFNAQQRQIDLILSLRSRVAARDPVERIYINLATDTDPEYYDKFGRKIIATYNTFQTAFDLFQSKRLTLTQLIRVGQDMVMNYGFTPDELAMGLEDLLRRKFLLSDAVEESLQELKSLNLLPPFYEPNPMALQASSQFYQDFVKNPSPPAEIDYIHDFR